ncbi:proteoglycan 4-like isoform X4 [Eriocheir sinensis]|uniref:proteoglycan 4-like isoform X4 n=1 Tax=Eriocheir sinensis TaxID=95602 RepID=UPI0021C6B459|nr:proteoglycan 4-like isoform X4 [Eriocheir sinensis]
MVKPGAKKPGPPKVKKSGPFKIKQTVTLKPKKTGSPTAKKTGSPAAKKAGSPAAKKAGSPAAKKAGSLVLKKKKGSTKFLALKKANDGRFRKRSVQRRQAFKRGEGLGEKRGVVVISNIPHGFFEGEMERYFRQFGVLENIRLVRSKRTGQSCGYAYVEFEHYEVAKIVAKYMDGYLTFGKIMKCKILPPEAINSKLFRGKDIRPDNCPKLNVRKGAIKKLNKTRTEKQIQRRVARLTSAYTKKTKKLEELGVYIPLQTLIGKPPQKEEKEGEEATKLTNGHTASEDSPSEDKEEDQTNLSFPEDVSDVEPSEDINSELTEEQKGELIAEREALAALIKSHLSSAKKTKPKKKAASKSQAATSTEKMVLEVDESEDEVVLKTPPNVIKKYVKMGSKSTPKVTPKGKVLTLKGKSVTPKAKKMKMVLGGKTTPKGKNTTPKAKKIKLSPQGEDITLESTENMTPKAKKTKLSPKGETKTPKGMKNTPKQKSVAEETWTATPMAESTTPGTKNVMLKLGKATPSSEKKAGTKKIKKATPKLKELPATPREEELESVKILTTPKTKKKKLKELPADDMHATPSFEVEEISTIGKLATPKIKQKTPKSKNKTPKMKNTPTPLVFAPEVLETLTTPKSKVKTPKVKKHTPKIKESSAEDTQATPSLETLALDEITAVETLATPKTKVKTPKAKKQTPNVTSTSENQDTPASKKKTPKLKRTGDVGENKENKGDSTPKPKKTAPTPTPVTIPTTLENAEAFSEATPGKKKKDKANHTPKTTPGGKRKQDDAAPVIEATPGKKEMGNSNITPKKRKQGDGTPLLRITPGQKKKATLATPVQAITTSPKTPKKAVTPFKTTPGKKTPKVTPGKRKTMLEVLPDGKSHGKKHKVLSAT